MNWRAPKFNHAGGIDCEIEHPELGWIPNTVAPGSAREAEIIAAGGIAAYDPPPPTAADVNAERERRFLAGANFTVTGYAPEIAVSGDGTTQTNLLALATAASARIGQGDATTITHYRDEANEIHELTPPQVFELWSQGAAFVSGIYQASWALKDGVDGVPADYREDVHWP